MMVAETQVEPTQESCVHKHSRKYSKKNLMITTKRITEGSTL